MTKQKTYYLSSKMTGLDESEWRDSFLLKGDEISRLNGWNIINPANFTPEVENPQWKDFILEDIQVLCDKADGIYMFGEWWSSCGAWVELLSAIRTGKEIAVDSWWQRKPVEILTKFFRKRM